MRVIAKDDGKEKMPKWQYAEAIKSHIKMSIIEDFKIDISDSCLFPDMDKRWKAFISELVANGRNETVHHPEIDPETLQKIYELLANTMDALKSRGTSEYEAKLAKIRA